MFSKESIKITIRDLDVSYDDLSVLSIESLDIPSGKVTAIIGPNGSGKSTLLRSIQLLNSPTSGELRIDGRSMKEDILRTRRRMASVFQEPLLLNCSVLKNVETALRLRGFERKIRREQAIYWLDRYGVLNIADRHAHKISGGEAQRVSLARAFAVKPEVLLLDEPFSALDQPTRFTLIEDFSRIVHEMGLTTILVTHDRDEAARLADVIIVLIDGKVRQIGNQTEIFASPVDSDVAKFVGVENIFATELVSYSDGIAVYLVGEHLFEITVLSNDRPPPQHAFFCLRPEQITVYRVLSNAERENGAGSARNKFQATVLDVEVSGSVARLSVAINDETSERSNITLTTIITKLSLEELGIHLGSQVSVGFKATAAHVLRRDRAFPTTSP